MILIPSCLRMNLTSLIFPDTDDDTKIYLGIWFFQENT